MKNYFSKTIKGEIGIELIIITIIVFFGIALVFSAPFKRSPTSDRYTPDIPTPGTGEDSLQLQTFKFKKYIPPTFDCENGSITGHPEPFILFAMSPDPGKIVGPGESIKLWYNDEWPLTLGSGSVSDNNADHIVNPNVGDEAARDANKFPYFPALFLSDITDDPSNKSGDAQRGGTPHKPDEIWGAWKPLGSSASVPPPNNVILPGGADPFPANSNIKFKGDTGRYRSRETLYGAEIIWKVNNLKLVPGRTYRAQFVIHDGDFEGDIGEGCTTIQM